MPFEQAGSIRIFRFSSLTIPAIKHAIFTRHGGVSPQPWRSLNFGSTVGDSLARVSTNKSRALGMLDRQARSVFDVWQVHSNRVAVALTPGKAGRIEQADAIVSDRCEVTLLMRFADCVPILVYDPARHAVGIAHAGWKGTARQTASRLVSAMQETFGCDPRSLLAAIGPSIGPDHYPVGPEVVAQIKQVFGAASGQHLHSVNGSVHLDLWSANAYQLAQAGVAQIEIAAICTACHLEDWYSHRGEGGRTGRFGAAIALNG